MKKRIIQIIYDMRTQPVVAYVTVIGTALTIFLIMTVMMMQQVKLISIAPETHRERMLYGIYIHIKSVDEGSKSESSGSINYPSVIKLYGDLDGVEEISYMNDCVSSLDLKGTNNKKFTGDVRYADSGIWSVFDYELLAGRYYTPEEVESGTKVAVVTRSTARSLFDSEDAVGQHFSLDHNDYEVIGIVEDVSKLASFAYGDVFAPIDIPGNSEYELGSLMAAMLVKEGISFEKIREQVKKRYAEYDAELASTGRKTVYHGAPFDQETYVDGINGSNGTPDPKKNKVTRGIIYAILLLVPAINLSTMLHSRLRRRVSEIGVRRAFGCTKARIIRDILAENFIVTLAGGILGLAAGILFALFYDGLYTSAENEIVRPALGLLLDWHILLFAFGACLVLNIISASVPAWQASRLNPVEAINTK